MRGIVPSATTKQPTDSTELPDIRLFTVSESPQYCSISGRYFAGKSYGLLSTPIGGQ